MKRWLSNRIGRRGTVLLSVLSALFSLGVGEACASDDFGNIVHHIEARYQVHRQHRFILGAVGMVVKVWHVAGVKSVKIALFEDQRFVNTATDAELDDIVLRAGGHGWQPMVRSYSRRSGDHSFIYAKDGGKDWQLLVVNVEPSEAVVVQVKVNPEKLFKMINGDEGGGLLNAGKRHHRERNSHPAPAAEVEIASTSVGNWDGTCLFFPEDQPALP